MNRSTKIETAEAAAALASLSGSSRQSSFEDVRDVKGKNKADESGNESDSSEGFSSLAKPIHAPPVSRMMVDHTYVDFSVLGEDELALLEENKNGNLEDSPEQKISGLSSEEEEERARTLRKLKRMFGSLGPTRKNSGGVVQPFPEKLMDVLDRDDMGDVLSWMPHGRAFIVKQPRVFDAEVLPRFFKQSKFTSFTRQLNLWGFKRITKGPDARAYYHELFLRGRPKLCSRMRRQRIKGTGIKLTPNPEMEPNFYELAKKRPLPEVSRKKETKPLPSLPAKPTGQINNQRRNISNNQKPAGNKQLFSLMSNSGNCQRKVFPLNDLLAQQAKSSMTPPPITKSCFHGIMKPGMSHPKQSISPAIVQQHTRGMDLETRRRVALLLREKQQIEQQQQHVRQLEDQLKMQGLVHPGHNASSVSELKNKLLSAARVLDQFDQGQTQMPREHLNSSVFNNMLKEDLSAVNLQGNHVPFASSNMRDVDSVQINSSNVSEVLAVALQQQRKQAAMLQQLMSEVANQRNESFVSRQGPSQQVRRPVPMAPQHPNGTIRGLYPSNQCHPNNQFFQNLRR